MTREQITTIASEFLTSITEAEGISLLRAEYHVNDAIAAVYFLEYSDDEIPSDLSRFQEEHISSDYYNHPGYLQWNYYLIFLRPEGFVTKQLKSLIEKDDTYTRKFVFTQQELTSYFTYTRSSQTVETDVIARWKEKLRAVDLDEVYTDNYYTEAIPRFLSNDVEKENIADQSIATPRQSDLHINRVSTITLKDNYRTHPQPNRHFEFKTVNLIRGANGTGKTSLLTSIELVVAGKTIGDPSNAEPGNCIAATYNGNEEFTDEYTPNDNLKYRKRDVSWYSSSYQTGNELYRTFNRYNYFDSDAAYNLAFDEDKRHITKYLSAIALGPEFGRIQDRMKGFENRLGAELRTKQKAIEAQEARIEDARKIEQAITIAADPQAHFAMFLSTGTEVGWKAAMPVAVDADTVGFETAYQEGQAVIQTLEKLLHKEKLHSLSEAMEMRRKYMAAIAQLKQLKQLYIDANDKANTSLQLAERVKAELEILSKAKLYFDNPTSFTLPELIDELSVVGQRIAASQEVAIAFAPIESKELFKSSEQFRVAQERLNVARTDALRNQQVARQQKDALMQTLDQIKNVVSEIKALGTKFLTLEQDADACPLCETPYSTKDLQIRINNIDLATAEDTSLKIFNEQILRAESELASSEMELKELREIEEAIRLLQAADVYKEQTFIQIYKTLQFAKQTLQADTDRQQNLLSQKALLEQKGITKEIVLTFKREFQDVFAHLIFDSSSSSAYSTAVDTNAKRLVTLEDEHRLDKEEEQTKKAAIDDFSRTSEIPGGETDPESYLQYQIGSFNNIIRQYDQLRAFFNLQDDHVFVDISRNLTKLDSAFHRYRKSLADQSQINTAKESLLAAQHEIDEMQPVVEKISRALPVIQEILTTDNEEAVLGDFLTRNEADIQEIFLTLHKPKEFSRIEFDHEQRNVYLYKGMAEQRVSLNKISTGQRSALALSIFLALHRKMDNGPKILLFDDPVTYVDDLNILSFLDYLRELVIKEDRQLFFSTANQKLAGLFEKKFAFLAQECQTIPLERVD